MESLEREWQLESTLQSTLTLIGISNQSVGIESLRLPELHLNLKRQAS